jgi:hypothetical protein
VVCVILRVVEFDQERRRLYAVIVQVAWLNAAGPGEANIAPGLIDLIHAPLRQFIREIVRVQFHQCAQRVELPGVHLRCRKPRGLPL